jgi:NADH-quinone oxidoreductase subunit M
MLSVVIFVPSLVAAALALAPRVGNRVARWLWVAVSATVLVLVAGMWLSYDPTDSQLAYVQQVSWMPGIGASYHVGVDGLSLPLLALTAVLFLACAVYSLREHERPRTLAALFLFLETTCLGLFAAQDLIVFFVFFDLSIVGMYFAIARWGHGDAARSALKFFLYTFLGSLALLLGFIGLYVAADPGTFDIPGLTAQAPLTMSAPMASLVLGAIMIGLAVKTPTVPFHTWLPPAHTDAPAIGSAILAGLLLKMGTYGFVRIAMPMLPGTWRDWSWLIIVVGLVSAIYGALVAMAQTDLKRMIAYTSVNHMGYVVLGVGLAGLVADNDATAREIAVTGAVTQMVAHGLITGALFLLAGVLQDRAGSYALDGYGGLAGQAPRLAVLFAVGAFASLGLPGFAGFIAEFHIFTGGIAVTPVAAVALLGIVITAGLFLRAYQRIFAGPLAGLAVGFGDLRRHETVAVGALLSLALVIGIVPQPVLRLIEPASAAVVALVTR